MPVYPVLIQILPPPQKTVVATSYKSEVMGLQARQDYHVINLWEIDVGVVFQNPIPPLLPFAPILKGGGEVSVIRRALQDLRSDERLSDLEPLLAFFASFVLDSELVQKIMRWDMTVLRESPWYQELIQEGIHKELMPWIELGLKLKFGEEGLKLVPRIYQIEDLERLRYIRESLETVETLEELCQICKLD